MIRLDRSYAHLALFERVLNDVVFPDDDLLLFLRRNVLNPDLLRKFLVELANEPRIPELASNTKILTTTHQGI